MEGCSPPRTTHGAEGQTWSHIRPAVAVLFAKLGPLERARCAHAHSRTRSGTHSAAVSTTVHSDSGSLSNLNAVTRSKPNGTRGVTVETCQYCCTTKQFVQQYFSILDHKWSMFASTCFRSTSYWLALQHFTWFTWIFFRVAPVFSVVLSNFLFFVDFPRFFAG